MTNVMPGCMVSARSGRAALWDHSTPIELLSGFNVTVRCVDDEFMLRQLAYSAAARITPGQDRRARGRVRQQGVMSNLGVVIDLSGGGVRVLSTHELEGKQQITISCQTDSVELSAEVVWCKRVGFRRYVSGMKFIDLDENALRVVSRIASTHRLEVAI